MSKIKKVLIPILAVAFACAGDYFAVVFYDLLPDFAPGFKNNILQPASVWLFTYGALLVFGLIYYGKDKRILRFPLAYAFGFAVQQVLWAVCKMIEVLIGSVGESGYVDTVYFAAPVLCIGAAVALVTLFVSLRRDALFCETADSEGGELTCVPVRRRIHNKNAYAIITAIVFGISFFVVRTSTRLGYYLAVQASALDDAITLRVNIVDVAVCLAEIVVCYLLSLGFCANKKGAFYFLELFLFAGSVSSIFDGFSRYALAPVVEAFNAADVFVMRVLNYIPVAIGDVMAIIISVLAVKWLVAHERKRSCDVSDNNLTD